AHRRGGRYLPRTERQLHRPAHLGNSTTQGYPSHHAVPHRSARRPYRCLSELSGSSSHLLQHCQEAPVISYNSCRNRHCNKCQSQARERWMDARRQELLQTRYFHVVFTLPHELHTLVWQNQEELYNLLFRTVAETLREVARNSKHLG